jgi:putative flavoprotein involved in K+ transport
VPRIPAAGADLPASVHAIHSRDYRAPGELPEGGVLVVGAGSSGHQIALELAEAGRPVVLAVGGHARAVRRYRGRDLWAWLRDLGQLDRHAGDTPKAARRSPGLPLDGRNGGQTIDLRVLADAGVTLAGRLTGVEDGAARFGPNLVADIVRADARLRALLDRIDRHIEARGADAPPAEPFRAITPPAHPPASLDLAAAGLGTVIWATGFRREHPWLHVDVRDREGELLHERGVTRVPGLYFLGLRWQHTMTSHQLGGVGRDAAHLAAHMAAAEAPEALAA